MLSPNSRHSQPNTFLSLAFCANQRKASLGEGFTFRTFNETKPRTPKKKGAGKPAPSGSDALVRLERQLHAQTDGAANLVPVWQPVRTGHRQGAWTSTA